MSDDIENCKAQIEAWLEEYQSDVREYVQFMLERQQRYDARQREEEFVS